MNFDILNPQLAGRRVIKLKDHNQLLSLYNHPGKRGVFLLLT